MDGALALADEEGLEGLTIRRLAQRLGVTPMALYWHFKNKDELHVALVDRVWSLVDTKVDPAAPWYDRLRTLMESVVGVLRVHPSAAQLLMTAWIDAPYCYDSMEAALAILAEGGFEPEKAGVLCGYGLRTAITLVIGDPNVKPTMTCEEVAEVRRQKRIRLATLPPDRYRHMVDAAPVLAAAVDSDASIALGIDIFVAGVRAIAPNG